MMKKTYSNLTINDVFDAMVEIGWNLGDNSNSTFEEYYKIAVEQLNREHEMTEDGNLGFILDFISIVEEKIK